MELKREQALIRAAQQGDENALSEIYNAYVDNIYRYFLYRVDGTETAQDLTAEVFLRVVEGISDYQDRDVPVLAWIYRIAHARLVDHYRQQRQNHEDLDDVELSTDDDLDGVLMSSFHQDQIRQALRLLTPEQQQVIILRFIEGYSLQKTAETLGKKIGAVKVMQHRALEALSRRLSKQDASFEQNS